MYRFRSEIHVQAWISEEEDKSLHGLNTDSCILTGSPLDAKSYTEVGFHMLSCHDICICTKLVPA